MRNKLIRRVLQRARMGVGLLAGLVLVCQTPAAPPARLGVWKLAGPAEFLLKSVPPHGPAKHSHSGGWTTVYEVADGKVRFTSTLSNNPKVLVVGETQWERPPLVIVPGDVIPVAGTAVLAEYRNGGLGFGSEVGLACQFGGQMILGTEKGNTLRARSHPAGGQAASRKVDYRNTTEFTGQKGLLWSDTRQERMLVFTTAGAGFSPQVGYRYVWSAGDEVKGGR